MRKELKTGDIIVGRKGAKYENKYFLTTAKKKFIGKIIGFDSESQIRVQILSSSKRNCIGEIYTVNKNFFELLKDNEYTLKDLERMGK